MKFCKRLGGDAEWVNGSQPIPIFNHRGLLKSCSFYGRDADMMGGTRDFHNVQEMNGIMVYNWNQCVKSGDLVFHLGDVAFPNKGDGTEIEEILDKLNGQIYLIQGNHDHKNKFKKLYEGHPKFVKIEDLGYIKLDNKQKVMLCHYPMLTWRASCHGSWHLHAHCHGQLPEYPGLRIDVGMDTHNFFPYSEYEIIKIATEIKNKNIDLGGF